MAHPPPGGESYADLADRARAWLAEHSERENLIAVSHGAIGRVLRGVYLDLPIAQLLIQDEPQDAFFRFGNGRLVRYDTEVQN